MIVNDTWTDKDIDEILDRLDTESYQKDTYRQPPKLTRKQAAEADREERQMQFIEWLMISRYSDYCPFARHDF